MLRSTFILFLGLTFSTAAFAIDSGSVLLKTVNTLLEKKDHKEAFKIIDETEKNPNFPNTGEIEYTRGLTYESMRLHTLALKQFMLGAQKFPGTTTSYEILKKIEHYAIEGLTNTDELLNLFNSNDYSDLPRELISFYSYFKSKSLVEDAGKFWKQTVRTRIYRNSYWYLLRSYEKAIDLYAKEGPRKSLKYLNALLKKSENYAHLNFKIRMNIARMNFEIKKYKWAIEALQNVEVVGRQKLKP
ncbi:MAG: hypothetical protein R2827_15945 [Bdellovibrionales bacterium]